MILTLRFFVGWAPEPIYMRTCLYILHNSFFRWIILEVYINVVYICSYNIITADHAPDFMFENQKLFL